MMKIGIDLGGTKIAALALGPQGRALAHFRVPTPNNYSEIIGACVSLVKKIQQEADASISTVGICTPGIIDMPVGVIRFSPNIPSLKDAAFVKDLSAAIDLPVRLANDAACFALSESVDGAGAMARVVYGVILGTGVGGALVVDKRNSSGPNGATEWGHLPLPWPEASDVPKQCGCGKWGDIESYLSGPALHRQLQERMGRPVSNDALVAGLLNKDGAIMEVMDVYLTRLSKALAMLITLIDPDAIVLGGGVSNLDVIYEIVPERISRYLISGKNKTSILKAKYGDDSGMRGAAWL